MPHPLKKKKTQKTAMVSNHEALEREKPELLNSGITCVVYAERNVACDFTQSKCFSFSLHGLNP